ncbi:hypothetical protein ACTFIU_005159 [Dictyostelium citrinum]
MEGTLPVFDSYCFYIHRLKMRSKLNYKTKLVDLCKETSNPFIVSLAKDISDASDNIDNFFFSTKARDLANIDTAELLKSVETYCSLLGGLIGSKVYQPTIANNTDNAAVAATATTTTVSNFEKLQLSEQPRDNDEEYNSEEAGDNDDKLEKLNNEKVKNNNNKGSDAIRKNLRFSWSTVFGLDRSITSSDTLVEYMSILFNLGIWYLGYSEYIVSNRCSPTEGLPEEDRQKVYDFLLKSAGIFDYLCKLRLHLSSTSPSKKEDKKEDKEEKTEGGEEQKDNDNDDVIDDNAGKILKGSDKSSTDFNDVLLRSLYLQCIGQAQELTIGRAYKKNTIQPIVKLAVDTANIYKEAMDMLISHFTEEKLAENRLEKFVNFLQYKVSLYQSLALNQQAFQQNATHKYGESIATCKKAQHQLKQTLFLIRPCVSITLSQQSLQKPTSQLQPIIDATLARLERENVLIGYEVVPSIDDISDLPSEGTRLAKLRPFVIPQVHQSWSTIDIPSTFNKDKKLQESDLVSVTISK